MNSEILNSGKGDSSAFESLASEREFAEKVAEKTFYAGIFVDREDLYQKFVPKLEKTIDEPHITTNFAPNEMQLHMDELGSKAKIFAVGYGNDGKNEGILVRVEADDPVIQAAVDAVKTPHITLSVSEDSHPMYTSNLEFKPLEEEAGLSGEYCLHLKNEKGDAGGELVNSIEALKKLSRD